MAETVQVTLDGTPAQRSYTDEQYLRSVCADEATLDELAAVCECAPATVRYYLRHYGITTGTEQAGAPDRSPVPLRTRHDGYEYWKPGHRSVLVHRLLAVAEWGFDAVVDRIVPHCTGIRWDNRPSQLALFESHREHMRCHARPSMTADQLTLPESLPAVDQSEAAPARDALTPSSSQSNGQAPLDEFGVFG